MLDCKTRLLFMVWHSESGRDFLHLSSSALNSIYNSPKIRFYEAHLISVPDLLLSKLRCLSVSELSGHRNPLTFVSPHRSVWMCSN